jgi:Family of unknown function (DUF5681)
MPTWKPGESGNRRGRPVGTGHVAKLRMQLAARLDEVIESVVNAAVNGDVQAARLVLERTIPPLRAEELPVPLGNQFAGSRTELVAAVVQALADGRIDTARGGRLIALLSPDALEERADHVERLLRGVE